MAEQGGPPAVGTAGSSVNAPFDESQELMGGQRRPSVMCCKRRVPRWKIIVAASVALTMLVMALLMVVLAEEGVFTPPYKPEDFTGVQVNTRSSFGYGTYVFEGLPNVEKEAVVTGFFTFVPRPAPGEHPDLSGLWRWSEIDWEFVPHSKSPQRERVQCSGRFPTAACSTYRTNGADPDPRERPNEIAGHYTNDLIAQSVGAILHDNDPGVSIRNWQELVDRTGDGRPMRYGEEWPLPMSLCYKRSGAECTQMLPDGQDMLNSVAINIFRTPAGTYPVTARGVTGTFVPHKKADDGDVSGFAMTNEQFIHNAAFDPHQSYHTYTIRLLPTGITFYIDAPGGGFDLANAAPVQHFNTTDYPDLGMFGPQMPGGTVQWTTIGGQQVTDPGAQPLALGFSQMMMNIWIAEGWGGTPGRFKTTTTYVKRVAFQPLDGAQGPQFAVDFTTWSTTQWFWPQFRKFFMAEQATDGTKSAQNVDLVKGPDGKPCLRLLLNHRGALKGRGVYQVAPGKNAKVTLDGSGEVIAWAEYPHYDVFPFPPDRASLDVWVHRGDPTTGDAKCGYRLTKSTWALIDGRGDVGPDRCSFMPKANEQTHLMKLPDDSTLVTLAVG